MNTLIPLIFIPLIGSFIIGVMRLETPEEKERGKKVGLLVSIISLIELLRIW
jgi:NADH:ubiquinone oxidoreductase subunit 4 (subunit M)